MKVHFTFLWIIFFILAYYSNAMKTYCLLFFMLLIHESAHIGMAQFLGLKVEKMVVYPFGFGAEIEHLDHVSTFDALLILFAGLSMHLLFPFAIRFFESCEIFSHAYSEYLIQLNFAVLFFNCCPIYPLDGGRILDAGLHLFFNYSCARKITLGISVITFVFLIPFIRWNMAILFLFIGYQLILAIWNQSQDRLQFYFYRYRHPLTTTQLHRKELYRNHSVILKRFHQEKDEKDWLKEMFS